MRKHFTRILTTLLSLAMLLPIVVQAAPADGWTDEAEQAYQTVTELVIQRVTESKDYLATATQEENAKVVYALWTSGATVPSGFYDEYLQALADWLDLAVKRGKTAYIPGAIRTVAAMGLDVTDFAGYDLMDTLRKPELVEADEDRLDMLMDLDAAGDAGKTDEFNALREQLLTEALARQQSSGEFRYTSQWPAGLKQNGVVSEPDRCDYILLTAKSVQALAPYQSRKDVSTAIDKALNYLSGQQLSSGGFLKYSDEDVEEDAAVMEMLTALDISLADERFTKDGHTVLDGMMGWYQDFYFEEAENAPNQGFYRYDIYWDYNALWGGWYYSSFSQMPKPPIISSDEELFEEYMGEDMAALYLVIQRIYINPTAYTGLCSIRPAAKAASVTVTAPAPSASENASTIGFSKLLDEQKALFEQEVSDGSLWNEDSWMVTESDIASFARDILALEKANGGFSEEEKAQLSELMKNMMLTSKEYYYKKKSKTLSCGAVRALVALGMDPGNVEGLDYLAPLTSLDGREFPQLDDLLKDVDAVDPNVWRARGIDADMLVDEYLDAAERLGYLPMFMLALTTGLRQGELIALKWSDLDIESRTLTIAEKRAVVRRELVEYGSQTRSIRLTPEVVDLLIMEHSKHPSSPLMFMHPATLKPYSPQMVRRMHNEIIKEAGIDHIRYVDLRHTCAILALKNGMDTKELARMLGHYRPAITRQNYEPYLQHKVQKDEDMPKGATQSELQQAANILDNLLKF